MTGVNIIINVTNISFNRNVFNKNFQFKLQLTGKATIISHIYLRTYVRAGRKHGHKKQNYESDTLIKVTHSSINLVS